MDEPRQPFVDRLALGLARFVVKHRAWVVLASLALVIAAASGGRHLVFSNNYRVFFSPENPELLTFEAFQDVYTKNDNALFVVKPREGSVFTPEVAEVVEELTQKAWQIPYAIRVDSISNFQHSWAEGDDLTVEDLIRDGGALTNSELGEKERVALAEPLLAGRILAHDSGATGVNVTLQYPEESLEEVPQAMAAARELKADVEARYPSVEVALTGLTPLNYAFVEAGMTDAATLIPLMYLALIVGLVIALRSTSGTVATLIVIAFSTATAMGLAGFLGIRLSPISITAPTIILTLSMADSVHLLITFRNLLAAGWEKSAAIAESLRVNLVAVTITSLTTVIGFLSLNFSDAPPFWDLGNITALGIAAAWLYSVTLLPAAMSFLPFRVKEESARRGGAPLLERFADLVIARHRPILAVMGIAAVTLISFVPFVDLNDEWVKYFDDSLAFRRDSDFATEHLTGLYGLEYSVEAASAGGINDPAYLRDLERFVEWLRGQEGVRHVTSYTDIIKRLNKNLHGDDPTFYRLPDDQELAAQYLLLYELSLPYGLDLNDRINIDKSATRVTVTLDELSTADVRTFIERAESWLHDNVPQPMWAKATGATVMFSHISERNIHSMLRGNALAIVAIAVIMALVLRSFSLGFLSLVTNSVPILMTFGLWALLVGQVGMVAATISATSLGIVVDDTVHFLSKYLRARREKGMSRPDAVRYAFATVGQAIVLTTVVLAVGFAVLSVSTFRINAEMGLLTAIAILIALAVDLLLLPALLVFGHENVNEQEKGMNHEDFVVQPA